MIGIAIALSMAAGTYLLIFDEQEITLSSALGAKRFRDIIATSISNFGKFKNQAALFAPLVILTWLVFGTLLPTLAVFFILIGFLRSSSRSNLLRRRGIVTELWPHLLEETKLLSCTAGKSIPTAFFASARKSPASIQSTFVRAERVWNATADFERAMRVVEEEFPDPISKSVCETLLVCHELGGSGVSHRLTQTIEERRFELDLRRDGLAKQAGANFARKFVLVVPIGMALVGLSIGNGRAAYATSVGQVLVIFSIAVLSVCWYWSGRLLRIPEIGNVG